MAEVFWIEGSSGLAIVERPGGDSRLERELQWMKEDGVDTLVSLLYPDEAEMLGLAFEGRLAELAGITFFSHPIQDGSIPSDVPRFSTFVADLAGRIVSGRKVAVHCRASIGRATVAAACTLIHLGWDARDALEAIAVARGYAVPDTMEQEDWILAYKPAP